MFMVMRQACPGSKQFQAVGAISLGGEHKFCMFQLQSIGVILTSPPLRWKIRVPTLMLRKPIPNNYIIFCLIQAHDYICSVSRNYAYTQIRSFLYTRSNQCRRNNSNLGKKIYIYHLPNARCRIAVGSESSGVSSPPHTRIFTVATCGEIFIFSHLINMCSPPAIRQALQYQMLPWQ